MTEQKYFKRACEHCHGHIEFPSTALSTRVSCPHCGQQTHLREPAQGPTAKAACQNCGGRIAFPAAAAGSTVSCPHCSTKTELTVAGEPVRAKRKMGRAGWLVVGAGALIFLAVAGIAVFGRWGRGNGEEVELRQFELLPARGGEPAVVAGKIVNHTKLRFYSVKVEFALFDHDGKPVGNSLDYLSILEPKDSWDFKAEVSQTDAASAKLVKIAKER